MSRTKLQGIVEKGGQRTVTQSADSSTYEARTFPGATVTVYLTGTLTLATIYADASGTSKPNPFTAGSDASWAFYIDNGVYDIKFSPSGFAAWTLSAISVGDSGGIFIVAPPPSGGDDFSTLQGLITTNNALGITVSLQQGIYLTSAELVPAAGHPLKLLGVGQRYGTSTGSVIQATTLGMRSILSLSESYSLIEGIKFDGNRKSSYGIYINGSVGSRFINGAIANCVLDGVHNDSIGNNQSSETDQWFSTDNGKTYATAGILSQYPNTLVRQAVIAGTASTTAGNNTITIAGGPDLTTLGIRTGFAGDMVRVGSTALTAFYGQILSVTANTIVLQASPNGWPTQTLSGQDYAIGIGWGWYEESSATNGFASLHNSWFRNNGAGGVFMNALYGDHVGPITLCDFNNFTGIAMGLITNSTFLSQPVSDNVYMEGNIGPDYVIGAIGDAKIDTPGGGSPIFSIGGGVTNSTYAIIRGGTVENGFGKPQNFLLIIQNVAGTIKHQIVAELRDLNASLAADKVSGASATLATTPIGASALDATHGFVSGAGILAGTTNFIILNTPGGYANSGQFYGSASIENQKISSGTQATIPLRVQTDVLTPATNINGVSRERVMFIVSNGFTNASADLTAGANGLPVNGDFIAIRFSGYIK